MILDHAGSSLAVDPAETHVLRATVLSIVVTLGLGPNTAVLCTVWCHPAHSRTFSCPHQNAVTSPRATGEDSCPAVSALTTAFVRDETRQGSGTAGITLLGHVTRVPFVSLPSDTRLINDASTSLALSSLPVLPALRL